MRQYGPYQVSVRLPGEPGDTDEDVRWMIAEVLAERFGVDEYRPGEPHGHKPFPGVTVRIGKS